ncbi:lipopolysaccharide biosynthesis protein [Eoetvoesiella caeni]|uniref:O-antigen/teichoic acid export membrane protein n=1 Tax=Eoetvoesiella caeni TaxID=645616 RepID=A0A366HGE5_9BURK|nr:hypothetical protein [Eoetvoesiella caeni]MCI2807798.1 hypothetical protein [Eoetvoesiella caeni]NYT54199.1 hypothetical protein [Eoetvoesiella caeni]RBP41714.1 O-antigen/teichoic acid export membrane protein [Eoetvoesiella caeni]
MRQTLAFLTPERLQQLWYVPVLAFAMGLMMLRTLVMAQLFSLDGFAQFSAGLLVSGTFCMLACLGLQSLLQRDMPMMMVRRQNHAAAVLLSQCVLVACVCVLICIAGGVAGITIAGIAKDILVIGLLHGLSQQLFLIVTVESRSRSQSVRFARQNLVRGLGVFCLGSLVAFYTRSAQLTLITEATVSLILVQGTLRAIFRAASIRYMSAFRAGFRRIHRLRWRSAITLFFVSVVGFIAYSADRWMAAQALTTKQFALYSFAGLVLTMAGAVQVLINASVFPMLARRYAKLGRKSAYLLCWRVSMVLLIICAIFGGPAWFLIDQGVAYWFPKYQAVRVVLPLFIFVAILRVSNFWPSFMIISGFESRLLMLDISAGLIAGLFWVLWVQPWNGNGLGIEEIAVFAALMSACSYLFSAEAARRINKAVT